MDTSAADMEVELCNQLYCAVINGDNRKVVRLLLDVNLSLRFGPLGLTVLEWLDCSDIEDIRGLMNRDLVAAKVLELS